MRQVEGKTGAMRLEQQHQQPGSASRQPLRKLEVSGVLLVDKPTGLTSFAVVAQVRRQLHLAKVGHCGTLDPFATGLLILCLNQATRIVDQLLVQDKAYRCTLHLGVVTDTLDHTGKVLTGYAGAPPGEEQLHRVLAGWRGAHRQRVPKYAAVKVHGQRLYALARQGVEVETPHRDVHIHRLELVSYQWPEAVLEVSCSKGTYIRQLAADIGEALGCGGHLTQLRRLASGAFHVDQAICIADGDAWKEQSAWRERLISPHDVLNHLPAVTITDRDVLAALQNGHLDAAWESEYRRVLPCGETEVVRLVTDHHQLLALWWPGAAPGTRRLRMFHGG
jgi:tRNA pseudouridine55 synthase